MVDTDTPSARGPMPFHSILFVRPEDTPTVAARAPACFADLNLDQIVESITARRDEYDLRPFFFTPLTDVDAIGYRHEVMRDLQSPGLSAQIEAFADAMRTMREELDRADKLRYSYQKETWFADATQTYAAAVTALARDLGSDDLRSRGMQAFREFLNGYASSAVLCALVDEAAELKDKLAAVRYCLQIKGNRITVTPYDEQPDYSAEVSTTFEKFRQRATADHLVKLASYLDMNHVEAGILDLVAENFSETFTALDGYCTRHRDYLNQQVADFDREVQFYLAYLEYVQRLSASGLTFCYPQVSDRCKRVHGHDVVDLALAGKLLASKAPIVANDFELSGEERVLVVSGANQGGKSTFARTFGQLHYLASLGCLVPGQDARLFLFDRLFTHFEKEEDLHNLNGKLEDDLIRIHDILARATGNSIVIMNEIFASTTLQDAISLGTAVIRQIIDKGLLCVCVTFVDELSTLGGATVSLAATVDPDDPASRTYKVVRRPADGLAYAAAIAQKYGLTRKQLKGRITS